MKTSMVFDNEVLFKSKTFKKNFSSIVHQFNEYKFISLKKLGIYLDMDFVKHKGQPISSSKSIMNKLSYKTNKVEKKRKENFNEDLNTWFKERGFKKRRFEKRTYQKNLTKDKKSIIFDRQKNDSMDINQNFILFCEIY